MSDIFTKFFKKIEISLIFFSQSQYNMNEEVEKMVIKCKKCPLYYNVHILPTEEDNIIAINDKYVFPIYIDGKEYVGLECQCGAINIESKK